MKIQWEKDKDGNIHFYDMVNGFELKPVVGFVKSAMREMFGKQR